jgi:hypothetical protein
MPNKSPYWIDDETGTVTDRYFTRQNSEEFQGAFTGSKNFHPIVMAKESYNNSYQQEEKMNFNLDYEILPGFVYNGYVSMKLKTIKNRQFLPQEATGVTMDNVYANQSTDAYTDNLSIQSENKLLYRQNWDQKHNLVLAALWYTDMAEESSYTSLISGVASPGLSDPVTGGTLSSGSINREIRKPAP